MLAMFQKTICGSDIFIIFLYIDININVEKEDLGSKTITGEHEVVRYKTFISITKKILKCHSFLFRQN